MRIPSGSTDRKIPFVAVDATDRITRETGLTTWTVYRSRNGSTPVAMTTPTISELDATNVPGVYVLTVDEDTTLDASNDSEPMVLHITHADVAPVTIAIEIFRPDTTEGRTLALDSTGDIDETVSKLIRSSGSNVSVQITGSGHIAADVHELQDEVITSAHFATDAIDANAVADSATSEIFTAVVATQMTESYATDGTEPTLAQAVYMIQQGLLERSITGTTETIKQIDKTTTAATFTLDDEDAPTSKTRAT